MPRPTQGARLGGSASHQKHILSNLANSLFEHGKITTTEAKARRLRPYAEKLITHAKKGSLAHRRQVLKHNLHKDVVYTLFADIAPKFADRDGGYTRIIKVENRKGDNAPMAIIELVTGETVSNEASRATRAAASKAKEFAHSAGKRKKDAASDTAKDTAAATTQAATQHDGADASADGTKETATLEPSTAKDTAAEVTKDTATTDNAPAGEEGSDNS